METSTEGRNGDPDAAEVVSTSSEELGREYNHWHARLAGIVFHGAALVVIGVSGTVAVLLRDPPKEALPSVRVLADPESLTALQWLGVAVLIACVVGFQLSHAAAQQASSLPARLVRWVGAVERPLEKLPLLASMVARSQPATSTSRLVAIVGPILFSLLTGLGAMLVTGLGVRALVLGAAFSGFAVSLSGLLLEPVDTRVQTGGMFAALLGGALAIADVSWVFVLGVVLVGAFWIIVLAHVVELIEGGASWATFTMVGAGVAAFALLSELDNTLRSLTNLGDQPRGFGSLAPLTQPQNAVSRVREVAETWLDFRLSDVDSGVNAPSDFLIRSLYVLVDSAGFAIAYALLMMAAVRHVARRLNRERLTRPEHGDQLRKQLLSMLWVTQFAIPIIMIFDIAENLSGAGTVMAYLPTDPAPAETANLAPILAAVHWGTAVAKTIGFLGAAFAIVAAAGHLASVRRRLRAEERDQLRASEGSEQPTTGQAAPAAPMHVGLVAAIRIQRANVVLVVVLFLALRNGQTYDAIRRLARGDRLAWEVLVLIALVVGCAVAIRYLSELLEREVEMEEQRPADDGADENEQADAAPSSGGSWWSRAWALARGVQGRVLHGALAAAVAIVLGWLLGSPGALIPIGMWIVLELLSIPLRKQADTRALAKADIAVFLTIVGGVVAVGWLLRAWYGGTGVRWLLVGFGALVVGQALAALIGREQVRTSWFGLKPLSRSWFGLRPLFTTVPRRLVGAARRLVGWVVASMRSRLLEPVRFGLRTALDVLGILWRGERRGRRSAGATPGDDESVAAPRRSPLQREPDPSGVRVARALGGLVPVFVGAAVMRSSLGLALYDSSNRGGYWLLVVGAVVVLAGTAVFLLPPIPTRPWSRATGIAVVRLVVAAIFVAYLVGWQFVDVDHVITVTQAMTAIGVLSFAIALFAVIGTAISYLTIRAAALPALRLVGFEKVPFFALLVVWVLLASVIDGGGYHAVPTRQAVAGADNVGVNPRLVFDEWVAECASDTDREAVPMVFVAASGGGIRAAYWTATALERFDAEVAQARQRSDLCRQPVFAASGASGGSLGLAVWAANGLTAQPGEQPVAGLLDDDFLAPTVGWFLVADLVRPFMLWDLDGNDTVDRARVLELAWEDPWEDRPVSPELEPRCHQFDPDTTVSLASGVRETWCLGAPLLMLNGSEVNSACRFNTSVLDNRTLVRGEAPTPVNCTRPPSEVGFASFSNGPLGATIDLVDYICPASDVSLSTAALLSARFPFISPSGRVGRCDSPDVGPAFVVDGGYIDNSGASPLVELWAEVVDYVDDHNAVSTNTCIVPVFIQLDNGYEATSATEPSRPLELTVPLTAAIGARGSREAEAKQVAANIFTSANFSTDRAAYAPYGLLKRWVRIVPEAHPGVQAPLGWVLSDAARADLASELERDDGFAALAALLDENVTCDP